MFPLQAALTLLCCYGLRFDSFATTAAAPSAAAAAADYVQDNNLYRLSALAGTRTCARTIGTSQPALSS